MNHQKYKAVAFDLNGLILKGINFQHSWKAIWACLGYDDIIRKELYNKHHSNPKLYTYYQWSADCVEHFKAKRMHKTHINQIIEKYQITPASDFFFTLQELKRYHMFTAIISGGIDSFLKIIDKDIKHLIDKIFINTFHFDENGYLIGFTPYNFVESEFQAKSKAINEFCTFSNCNIKECVYVSDGNDSLEIMNYCGLSVVVDNSANAMNHLSNTFIVDTVSEIIPHILAS